MSLSKSFSFLGAMNYGSYVLDILAGLVLPPVPANQKISSGLDLAVEDNINFNQSNSLRHASSLRLQVDYLLKLRFDVYVKEFLVFIPPNVFQSREYLKTVVKRLYEAYYWSKEIFSFRAKRTTVRFLIHNTMIEQ